MSTLVLKPAALYAAYLAGRLDVPTPDGFDIQAFDDDAGPPAATLERMLAYDLGQTDRRSSVRATEPAAMADVVRRVREALGEPVRLAAVNGPALPATPPPVTPPTPDSDPRITFNYAGQRYSAPLAFYTRNAARLPNGRVIAAKSWSESMPPQPEGLHDVGGRGSPADRLAVPAEPLASPSADTGVFRAVPDGWIAFTFDGRSYAAPISFYHNGTARLPDGRLVRAGGWLESSPPQPTRLALTHVQSGGDVDAIEVRP